MGGTKQPEPEKECSVGLFEHADWGGGYVHIQGPHSLMSLKGVEFEGVKEKKRLPVSRRSRSLRTGPDTWVLAVADDEGQQIYFGPSYKVADLKSLGMDNKISSLQLWDTRSSELPGFLPGFNFGGAIPCFVWLAPDVKALSGGLQFEAPAKVPVLDWYRIYGPTKANPALALKTGPGAWVELYPETDFKGTPIYFEPDTILRDLSAYYPDTGKPWFKSLKLSQEEPPDWPGASLPPPKTLNVDKVVRTTLLNSKIRGATLKAVKAVPAVGGGLSFLTGALWPNPTKPKRVWNALSNAMTGLVSDVLSELKQQQLDEGLSQLYGTLDEYQRFSYGSQPKRDAMTHLLGALYDLQKRFSDGRPQQTLSYFVSLASISLAARHERLISYEALYGEKPTADDRKDMIKELRDLLAEFDGIVTKGRQEALDDRKAQIQIDKGRVVDQFDGWTSPPYPKDSPILKTIAAQCTIRITNEYGAELDDFLDVRYLWPYLIPADQGPDPKPTETRQTASSGPFGGPLKDGRKEFKDDNREGKPITRLQLWGGDRVDGIEVFYGGQSAGRHGGTGGGRHIDFTFGPDEHIVGAFGWDGDSMDQLVFRTDKGRELGVGRAPLSSHPWMAWQPREDARLVRISGIESTAALESLTLEWEYTRYE